jgi:glutamate synthase domain-containing protein 3
MEVGFDSVVTGEMEENAGNGMKKASLVISPSSEDCLSITSVSSSSLA